MRLTQQKMGHTSRNADYKGYRVNPPIMAPRDAQGLNPRTSEYVTFHGKRNFAGVTLRWGLPQPRIALDYQGEPQIISGCSKAEEGDTRRVRERDVALHL